MKTTAFSIVSKDPYYLEKTLERHKWAVERFGSPGMNNKWFERTYILEEHKIGKKAVFRDLRKTFYFKSKEDADLFKSRWV